MNKKLQNIFLSFLLVICSGLLRGDDFPKPTGWISDYAGVVDSQTSQKMDSVINELEQKTGLRLREKDIMKRFRI